MNSLPLPVIRALPLVGVLLLPAFGDAAEGGSTQPTGQDPAPAGAVVAAVPAGNPASPSQPDRVLSPRLAVILAVSLPHYAPATTGTEAPAGGEAADRSDAADDDSLMLRLPRHVVHGPKPLVLTERDGLTQRGLSDLAQRRYITQLDHVLNRFHLPLLGVSTESRALAMYAEDERLQNMADLTHAARLAALVDQAAGTNLQRLADATYQRTSEFGGDYGSP